jgi:hypothetical protein
MYINFKLGVSKGLNIADIGLLQAISQNRTEDLAQSLS